MKTSYLKPGTSLIDISVSDVNLCLFGRKNQVIEVQKLFSEYQHLLNKANSARQSNLDQQKLNVETKVAEFKESAQSTIAVQEEKRKSLELTVNTLSILIDREITNRQSFLKHLQESLDLQLTFYFQKKKLEINFLEKNIQQLKNFESDCQTRIKKIEAQLHYWEQQLSQMEHCFFPKQDPYVAFKKEMRNLLLKGILNKEADPFFYGKAQAQISS